MFSLVQLISEGENGEKGERVGTKLLDKSLSIFVVVRRMDPASNKRTALREENGTYFNCSNVQEGCQDKKRLRVT